MDEQECAPLGPSVSRSETSECTRWKTSEGGGNDPFVKPFCGLTPVPRVRNPTLSASSHSLHHWDRFNDRSFRSHASAKMFWTLAKPQTGSTWNRLW